MKVKLRVQTKDGQRGGDFETLQEAQDFFEDYRLKGLWGKEAHTVHHEEQVIHHEATEDILDENGVRIFTGIDAYDEVIPAWDEQIPAEYTYIIEDHTAEVEAKKAKKAAKVSRMFDLENINWQEVNTIVELKFILKHLVEDLKDNK